MSDEILHSARFGRRRLLGMLGGAGAGAWWALAGGSARAAAAAGASSSAATCVLLTPEATAGPYYIPNHLTRRDITEGQQGLPLQLRLTVEDVATCRPIAGANVEVWHANARGVYSGYAKGGSPGFGAVGPGGHVQPTNGARFPRGHQIADGRGLVVFETIYPGWYPGRAPHIHVKVHVGGRTVHTGQLFFPDALSDAVYRTAAYSAHGQHDTTDAEDGIYDQEGGSRAVLRIEKHRSVKGYVGRLTMGVRRA